MTRPLVFQHGAATTALSVVTLIWFGFEVVASVRQRLRAGGARRVTPASSR